MEKKFDEMFQNPGPRYRGIPFWGWYGQVNQKLLLDQITQFEAMGMGGAILHPRSMVEPEFLSPQYLDCLKACKDYFQERGMEAWLYDENGCPSGGAGGAVAKDRRYRQRYLRFTPKKDPACAPDQETFEQSEIWEGYFLACYEVVLEEGCLKSYQRIPDSETEPFGGSETEPEREEGDRWYAYLRVCPYDQVEDGVYYRNYIDTLNPKAVQKFVETSYEPLWERLGESFGGSIPAVFTDEPQIFTTGFLNDPKERRRVHIPFTDDLEKTYEKTYGESLLQHLPELFWELPEGKLSAVRYQYHDHLAERFAKAYADTLGGWCQKRGVMLTGHMMAEESLFGIIKHSSELMRSFRSFDMPGLDILCDTREYSTAKQAQSAAHQYGRGGMIAELYGVTDWDFDFKRHKLQGDWTAALGVTRRVHHITWSTMEGDGKRDFPASIGYQSPWCEEYKGLEDHFARVNAALTQGSPLVRIGVVHPIESAWLYYGCRSQCKSSLDDLEQGFQKVIRWLLFESLDFDFLVESTLADLYEESEDAGFHVGAMNYDAVLVPDCVTLRRSTLHALKQFAAKGGKVLFAGEIPSYLDGKPSNEIVEFARAQGICVPFHKRSILKELEPCREIRITAERGSGVPPMVYQLRQEAENRWLFLSHCEPAAPIEGEWCGYMEADARSALQIRVKGSWRPVLYDTEDGSIAPLVCSYEDGWTIIPRTMYRYDSLLLKLLPLKGEAEASQIKRLQIGKDLSENGGLIRQEESWRLRKEGLLACPAKGVPVTLSEPNVLLLDLAQWRRKGEAVWHPLENVNCLERISQEYPDQGMELKYEIHARMDVTDTWLALERPYEVSIWLNEQEVPFVDAGWFVDRSIRKTALPVLPKGTSQLVISYEPSKKAGRFLEPAYLLGDFSVWLQGYLAELDEPVRTLAFGDWTRQGLPFYTGNVTYHCKKEAEDTGIRLVRFSNPLLVVRQEGGSSVSIIKPPYVAAFHGESPEFSVTAYGHRSNAFGTVHYDKWPLMYFAEDAWRVKGFAQSMEYCLKPMGILQTPLMLKDKMEKRGENK